MQNPDADGLVALRPALTHAGALAVTRAAAAHAEERGWPVNIAVVDAAGQLIHFERSDDVHPASVDVAIAKARTAALFGRASGAFEQSILSGRNSLLTAPGLVALPGGVPIMLADKVVGAVGISGATAAQDAEIAAAGAQALAREAVARHVASNRENY